MIRKFPHVDTFEASMRHVRLAAQYCGRDAEDKPLYDKSLPMPTISYEGRVKVHGTNSSIRRANGVLTYQSRERELFEGHKDGTDGDPDKFMATMSQAPHVAYWNFVFDEVKDYLAVVHGTVYEDLVVFGEWCGAGIVKGNTAVNQVQDKFFIVFGVRAYATTESDAVPVWASVEDLAWELHNHDLRVHPITNFPRYSATIDFDNEDSFIEEKLEILTLQVEQECPVGAAFGIIGAGEGIFWQPTHSTLKEHHFLSSEFWFKTKGDKHKASRKKIVTSEMLAEREAIAAFVGQTVTEVRLQQGFDYMSRELLLPRTKQNISTFLKWVYEDIMREDAHTITEMGLDVKKLGSPISAVASKWYLTNQTIEI